MIRRPPRSTLFPYPTLSRSARSTRPSASSSACDEHPPPASPVAHRRTRAIYQQFLLVIVVHGTRAFRDRKSTRLNSSHANISYAVFCLKKKTPRPHGEKQQS